MLFNEYPYDCKNKSEIIEQIKSNKPLKKSNNRELDDLINKIFNQRISWDRFISHPFFLQDKVKLPSFNLYCEKHPNEYLICYCPQCKCNLCFSCNKEHSSKSHQTILFGDIGFNEDEMYFLKIKKERFENNLKKLNKMKDDIDKFYKKIKSIKENCSIYKEDYKNNFKIYYIDLLQIINEKYEFEKKYYELPKIVKWELKYIN